MHKYVFFFQTGETSKTSLKLFETKIQGNAINAFWRIEMKDALKPGETAVVSYFILH